MIKSQNETKLIGTVITNAEKINFDDGRRCLAFKLLTQIDVTNKDGDVRTYKEYHPILLWNSLADVNMNLQPNDVVSVTGRNHWKKVDGLEYCEIIADNCYKLK